MARPERVRILGVPIDRVSMASAVTAAEALIAGGGGPHLIGVCNTYTAVVARRDPALRAFYEVAALNLPDGMPLVWASRLYGRPIPERVSGPDFLDALAAAAAARGYRFFFLGAAPGVAEAMAQALVRAHPGLAVAGALAPPYGAFTEADNARMAEAVNAARTDVLWVGMSAPKQETWLLEMAPRLRIRLGVGVGAAFDFFAGRVKRAPGWMRGAGLEWAFRLACEPRRLWRRYLVGNSGFCAGVLAEYLRGDFRRE
jgi:N-acetylglucosaminyldiphosphoundecaprenol N-acetyl-beta-D-mannosaminyltransferase